MRELERELSGVLASMGGVLGFVPQPNLRLISAPMTVVANLRLISVGVAVVAMLRYFVTFVCMENFSHAPASFLKFIF